MRFGLTGSSRTLENGEWRALLAIAIPYRSEVLEREQWMTGC